MKISIVTVCYNSAKTIEQTIRSVLNQPYQDKEYIIIDGGSTDGTVEIIRRYESKLSYWCSEPDEGLYDAMNKGICKATGDVVGIINSDDWYASDVFGAIAETFRATNAQVLYGDVVNVSTLGGKLYRNGDNIKQEEIHIRFVYEHPGVFVRRKIYERYGSFNCKYKIAADYDLLLRFYCEKASFVHFPYVVAYFRLDGGLSRANSWRAYRELRKIPLEYSSYAKKTAETIRQIEARFVMKRKRNVMRFLYERLQRCLDAETLKHCWSYFLDNTKDCIIFGAGEDGIECYRWLHASGWKVRCFVDNAKERQKEFVEEIPILSPEILRREKDGVNVLIALTNHQQEAKTQLDVYAFPSYGYFDFYELQERFLKRYAERYLPWISKVGRGAK